MSTIHNVNVVPDDAAMRASLSVGGRALLNALSVRGSGTFTVAQLAGAVDVRWSRVPSLLNELAEQGAITVAPLAPDTFEVGV